MGKPRHKISYIRKPFAKRSRVCLPLAYGGLSLMEKDKNYLLAKIGIWMSGALVVFWICIVAAGLIGKADSPQAKARHQIRYSSQCHGKADAFQEREIA